MKESDLNHFCGSEVVYRHTLGRLLYTEGIQYMAKNAGAYWLIDAIASYQPQLTREDFQLWELEVTGSQAVLTCRSDSGREPLVKQEIEYTDFPFSIKLYVCNGTLMLPGEY